MDRWGRVDRFRELNYNVFEVETMTEPKLYSATDLAKRANVSLSYVARLCRQGVIPAVKMGHMWIIEPDDARVWLESRQRSEGQPGEH